VSSKVTITDDGVLLTWRWLNTCLPNGRSEQILCFALLLCAAFALCIKLSLSQPMNFLIFTLLVLSSIPLQGSEQEDVWFLVASWG